MRVDDRGHVGTMPIDFAVNGIFEVPGTCPCQHAAIEV
jgi:hypothetical protein